MKAVKIFAVLGFLWMASGIIYAFIKGDFIGELKGLTPYPWVQMSLLDLYSGLSLFSGWIIFRERSAGRSIAWIIALILLGNLATFPYAYLAATQSQGNWQRFWMGKRYTEG